MLQQIIASLLSAGALGLINYYVMDRLDKLDLKNDKLILPFLLLCSAFNYIIYLTISETIGGLEFLFKFKFPNNIVIIISLLLTIVISFFTSVYLSGYLGEEMKNVINKKRKSDTKVPFADSTTWKEISKNHNKYYVCYIYDFSGNPIGAGELLRKDRERLAFSICPNIVPPSLDSLRESLQNNSRKDVETEQYIDAEKQITVYFFSTDKKSIN